jgi:hypothetical protein
MLNNIVKNVQVRVQMLPLPLFVDFCFELLGDERSEKFKELFPHAVQIGGV